jgi:hypothetical protein
VINREGNMRARIARTRDGEFRYKRTTGTIEEVLDLARADGYTSAYLPDKSANRRKSWAWNGEWIEGRNIMDKVSWKLELDLEGFKRTIHRNSTEIPPRQFKMNITDSGLPEMLFESYALDDATHTVKYVYVRNSQGVKAATLDKT